MPVGTHEVEIVYHGTGIEDGKSIVCDGTCCSWLE